MEGEDESRGDLNRRDPGRALYLRAGDRDIARLQHNEKNREIPVLVITKNSGDQSRFFIADRIVTVPARGSSFVREFCQNRYQNSLGPVHAQPQQCTGMHHQSRDGRAPSNEPVFADLREQGKLS